MTNVWDKMKAAGLWIWNWITVIAATILGFLTIAVDYLDQVAGVDLTQVMTQRRAMQITFGVALTKGVVAAYNSRKAKV